MAPNQITSAKITNKATVMIASLVGIRFMGRLRTRERDAATGRWFTSAQHRPLEMHADGVGSSPRKEMQNPGSNYVYTSTQKVHLTIGIPQRV
ncbi:hypothetical protein [Bradyrhizobium uaiense]|uniref:hypothetical protein n=1 Tax=Bradyrhizobium uaiense TaxID=2594946 RepID=UPI0013D4B24E|nr:hypothetical protein [Bradyrhizobium uaiense]